MHPAAPFTQVVPPWNRSAGTEPVPIIQHHRGSVFSGEPLWLGSLVAEPALARLGSPPLGRDGSLEDGWPAIWGRPKAQISMDPKHQRPHNLPLRRCFLLSRVASQQLTPLAVAPLCCPPGAGLFHSCAPACTSA